MPATTEGGPARELLDITAAECWDLLAGQSLGRLAHTVGALPAVVPVRFAVRRGRLVVAAVLGDDVRIASRGDVVALEADEVDAEACTGWSVTAVGSTRLVRDPRPAVRLGSGGSALRAPPGLTTHLVVDVRMISGRRLAAATRS